jgi:serine/threonine protein kinase
VSDKAKSEKTVADNEAAKTVLHSPDQDSKSPISTNDVSRAYLRQEEIAIGPRFTRSSLHASGGMGKVWLARDVSLGRDVALKELQSETASGKRRFLREAQVTGRLEHPGIVPVYEMGRDPETGRPFYVMRFIRGRTLTEVTADFHRNRRPDWYEPMELVKLLTAFVSVCQTIAYAHSHGIVHRDLKGENIILGEFGEVIVLDWGLAKRLDGADDLGESIETDGDSSATAHRTMMGQVMGTPAYMAPEQAEGRLDLIGPSTDIFGLGAVLYEILTGSAPFSGTTVPAIIQQAKRGEVVPPHVLWPEVPPGLASACLKALSKSPSDRYATAAELGQEIQGWQDRQRRQAEDDLRRAFDRLRRQQTALVELTRTEIFTSSDLSAIFRELVEVAARTLGVERVSIWRFTADRKAIHCHALFELSANRHSSGVELAAETYPNYFAALAATDVIAADDAQQDPRTREFTDSYLIPLGIGAMMEVPIHPNGVLCHEHVGPPRKWLPDEQLFGIAVGHLAAHAISHLERRQALEQLALARSGTHAKQSD